jgi:hypothetical protein
MAEVGDAGNAGADGAAAAAAAAAAAGAAGAGNGAATPWYQGKVDAEAVGFWQRKGYDITDPVKVATELTKGYSGAERLIGVPPEELIRIPKPNAAELDVRAFWNKVGVPPEAKDYDFSAVKFSDGKELEQSFSDTVRNLFHAGRVPKDRAADIVKGMVAYMEGRDKADAAEVTATVQREREALDANWGQQKPRNMLIAQDALTKVGQSAGLSPEQIKKGWDALTNVGGIGASHALEMLRVIGTRMGEPGGLIGGGPGAAGDPALLSKEAAKQEIDALKRDTAFQQRLLNGDATERKRWDNLHRTWIGTQR